MLISRFKTFYPDMVDTGSFVDISTVEIEKIIFLT